MRDFRERFMGGLWDIFMGGGFLESFECFAAAASDEWENRGGAGHFFAPRPLHFLPRAHPMGGEGGGHCLANATGHSQALS